MSIRRTLLLFTLLTPLLFASEVMPTITAEELSHLFQFDGKIKVSDKTQEVSARHGDSVISAFLFEPDDNGFSRIMALTTKGGFLLNGTLQQKLEQAAPAVKKQELQNGSFGYIGLEGAGPGGEGYIAVAHVPEKNIDVQFKVIISNDGASQDSTEQVAKYHSILRKNSELQKALIAVLEQGVSNVAKSDTPAVEKSQKPPNAYEKVEKTMAGGPIANAERQIPTTKETEIDRKPTTAIHIWWQIGGLAALLALLLAWQKKEKNDMKLYRKKVIALLLILVVVVTITFTIVVYQNFHPKRIYEIPGENRIFAEAIDSADETIYVKAADWPRTFWKPFFLGDADWQERYAKTQYYLSNDGSVVALLVQEHNSPKSAYIAAYDFKTHEGFHADKMNGGIPACHQKVEELLGKRGDRKESPIEIPSLNSGIYR
jgi:hypothetical protein